MRVNNEIYWVFDKIEGIWTINLIDGTFANKSFMNPFSDGNIIYKNEYDGLNVDERYLDILTHDRCNQPRGQFALVSFDRKTQEFMTVTSDVTKNLRNKETPWIYDIKVFDGQLFLLRGWEGTEIVADVLRYEKSEF